MVATTIAALSTWPAKRIASDDWVAVCCGIAVFIRFD